MKLPVLVLLLAGALSAADIVPSGESLRYTINWPSGLSLGEGRMSATHDNAGWTYELQFEAGVPAFAIVDKFTSAVSGGGCSQSFIKEMQHGRRRTKETLEFKDGMLVRQTDKGGRSERQVSACARDALSFLYFVRRELAQGRIPSSQDVQYGSAYRVKMEFKGTQKVRVGEEIQDADRVMTYIKGPASDLTVELYFGKDAARTPLMAKIPLGLATFSVELVR